MASQDTSTKKVFVFSTLVWTSVKNLCAFFNRRFFCLFCCLLTTQNSPFVFRKSAFKPASGGEWTCCSHSMYTYFLIAHMISYFRPMGILLKTVCVQICLNQPRILLPENLSSLLSLNLLVFTAVSRQCQQCESNWVCGFCAGYFNS